MCAQNEDNTTYCVTGESIENAILVVTEVIDGVCMRTNCTDVTCNAAVANVSCILYARIDTILSISIYVSCFCLLGSHYTW